MSDDTHLSVRSIPELLHILPAPLQSPVQIHDTQFHQHSSKNSCCIFNTLLSCRSVNLSDQDKLFPCPYHVLLLQRNSGFWYWSFQKSVLHLCLCIYRPECLFSSYPLDLPTRSNMICDLFRCKIFQCQKISSF